MEIEKFAMHSKGLPFSLYRTHRSLSMQGSYAAASDIGAHHAAAWLIKADLLGAFPTLKDKAKALISYPRVRLGNDNLGLCKLPWVDVFNPDSENREGTDIFINPASQEIYAEFYNGMFGTDMSWQKIFEQTDRDINLQRIMNILVYGETTCEHDWIPDRAIGPIDGELYENERDFNDQLLCDILEKPIDEVSTMQPEDKQKALIDYRKKQLRELIQSYYKERGWSETGIPTVDTLKNLGVWTYLTEEARVKIAGFNDH
jgi:aldehyde:ferredoxin oxidoreductase